MPQLICTSTDSFPRDAAAPIVIGIGTPSESCSSVESRVCESSPSPRVRIASLLLSDAERSDLEAALSTLHVSTKVGVTTVLPAPWDPQSLIVAVGLGDTPDLDVLREAAGAAVRAALGHNSVTIALPHETLAELEAIAEGAMLGAYSYGTYKSSPTQVPADVHVVTPLADTDTDAVTAIIERAQIIAEAVHAVRDLVNMPANHLTTLDLAQFAFDQATKAGCTVEVWDKARLESERMAGLLAVGAGSAHEPRMVRVEWNPDDAQSFIALVGKGIIFDTGGYSLKPRTSMTTMKTDMTGAATVLETVIAAARLGVPHRVVAWLCIAENMVSGSASRVDDVITYRNGVSVEITNTDAEGRLVMADGLIMASEEKPDAVIDIATLTGAQTIALGTRYTGVMGTRGVCEDLVAAADAAGELAWQMPLPDYLEDNLKSPIADIVNSGPREAGMLLAGKFLERFAGETPWGHLDIAGPAFIDKAWGYSPQGGTGVMLRTLLEYIEQS